MIVNLLTLTTNWKVVGKKYFSPFQKNTLQKFTIAFMIAQCQKQDKQGMNSPIQTACDLVIHDVSNTQYLQAVKRGAVVDLNSNTI